MNLRQVAVEGVAAYLADEDASVYNITDAAVRQDALSEQRHECVPTTTVVAARSIPYRRFLVEFQSVGQVVGQAAGEVVGE